MKTNFIKTLFGVMLVSTLTACDCTSVNEETSIQDSTEVLNLEDTSDVFTDSLSTDSMFLDSSNVEMIIN
jgi:hypothetical protein